MSTMQPHEYHSLSDSEKLDLLRLLYHDIKHKEQITAVDIHQRELIVLETQKVYSRIKKHSH